MFFLAWIGYRTLNYQNGFLQNILLEFVFEDLLGAE